MTKAQARLRCNDLFGACAEKPDTRYDARKLLCTQQRTSHLATRTWISPQFGKALRPGGKVSCFSPVPSALIKMSWN